MPADNVASDTEFEGPYETTTTETVAPETTTKRLIDSPYFWLIVLLVMGLVVPFIPVPNYATALGAAIIFTVIYIVAAVQFAAHMTRLQLPLEKLAIGAVLGIGVWSLLQFFINPAVFGPIFETLRASRARPDGSTLLLINTLRTLTDLALVCAAVFLGAVVAQLIRTPNMLGPVCGIIAMIDIWGVLFGGIVSQLMTNPATEAASQKAMAAVPTVGAMTGAAARYNIPPFTVGVGDYLFLGLLFAALHLNGMNWRGAVRWIIPLIALTLLATQFVGHMPGLLPIGLGVALPNWKYFKYTREENFALLYAGLFVILLTVALYFGVMSMLPDKPPARS